MGLAVGQLRGWGGGAEFSESGMCMGIARLEAPKHRSCGALPLRSQRVLWNIVRRGMGRSRQWLSQSTFLSAPRPPPWATVSIGVEH